MGQLLLPMRATCGSPSNGASTGDREMQHAVYQNRDVACGGLGLGIRTRSPRPCATATATLCRQITVWPFAVRTICRRGICRFPLTRLGHGLATEIRITHGSLSQWPTGKSWTGLLQTASPL